MLVGSIILIAGAEKTEPETSLEYETIGFPYHALLDKLQPVNLYWDFDENTVTMQVNKSYLALFYI